MVQKCSNPECAVEFRYAGRGRLYSFEVRHPKGPCRDVPAAICERKPTHATVNFWLCENCCTRFRLQFSINTGLSVLANSSDTIPMPNRRSEPRAVTNERIA